MKNMAAQYPNLPRIDSRFIVKRIGRIHPGQYWNDACGRAFRLLSLIERNTNFIAATIWYYCDGEIRQAWQFDRNQDVSILAIIHLAKN